MGFQLHGMTLRGNEDTCHFRFVEPSSSRDMRLQEPTAEKYSGKKFILNRRRQNLLSYVKANQLVVRKSVTSKILAINKAD